MFLNLDNGVAKAPFKAAFCEKGYILENNGLFGGILIVGI
jgi:hypothetical protein